MPLSLTVMKTKLIFFCLFSFVFYLASAQVPQGFNYQAIARDASGNPIVSTSLPTRITIQSDSLGGTIFWQELQSSVTSNNFGLISLVLGKGVKQTGTAATFSDIDWTVTPKFIKTEIYYSSAWKNMGSSRLWTVPYAMIADNLAGTVSKLGVTGTTTNMEEALFEVKNNVGQTIFAVYNEGVRIWVDDGSKGTKGGFAVGGFDMTKGLKGEYLRVTRDSTRVYVKQATKGTKGGFAVGGFDNTKASLGNYLTLTPENYLIGHLAGKSITTGLYNSFIGYHSGEFTTTGSSNIFMGYLSGNKNTIGYNNVFIGNESGTTNSTGIRDVYIGYQAGYTANADYNSYIGYQAGFSTTTGGHNAFMGYKAGYANTTGYYNVFLGYYAGTSNTTGWGNTFVGPSAGYYNTTGNVNTFVGNSAGFNNTGGLNTFIGYSAGLANTSGQRNTFLGYYAGSAVTTGVSNVAVGTQAGSSVDINSYNTFIGDVSGRFNTGYYNTFLGYGSGYNCQGYGNVLIGYNVGQQLAANNKLVIENSINITSPLIGGDFNVNRVGINRMPTTYTLEVGGTIWANGSAIVAGSTTWSDVRYKTDIVPVTGALDKVIRMQGVKYNWRYSEFPQLNFPEGEQIGVIAQDIEKIVPQVVYTDPDGYKSVSYEKLVPVLIEAIKEQQDLIKSQQDQIDELKTFVNHLSSDKK
jgi:hypothetical protein